MNICKLFRNFLCAVSDSISWIISFFPPFLVFGKESLFIFFKNLNSTSLWHSILFKGFYKNHITMLCTNTGYISKIYNSVLFSLLPVIVN